VKTSWQVVLTLAAPDYTSNLLVLLKNVVNVHVVKIYFQILGWVGQKIFSKVCLGALGAKRSSKAANTRPAKQSRSSEATQHDIVVDVDKRKESGASTGMFWGCLISW